MSLESKIHLRDDEEIEEIVKRYYLLSAWKYVLSLGLLFADAFFLFYFLGKGWWGYSILGLVALFAFYILFKNWFFNNSNVLVITSHRIVDIDRSSWFDEVISSVAYADITDIFVRKKGMLSNILNYGILVTETKSSKSFLEIEKIKRPHEIRDYIWDRVAEMKKEENGEGKKTLFEKFLDKMPEYSQEELVKMQGYIIDRLDELSYKEEEDEDKEDSDE